MVDVDGYIERTFYCENTHKKGSIVIQRYIQHCRVLLLLLLLLLLILLLLLLLLLLVLIVLTKTAKALSAISRTLYFRKALSLSARSFPEKRLAVRNNIGNLD